MEFTRENIDKIRVVTVNLERATFLEAGDFQEVLDEEMSKGVRKIIIDLSLCSYIDSVFLGAVISSLRKMVAIDGDIKLVKPSISETNMFLLHSLRIFDIYDSKNEAIHSFSKIFVAPPEEFAGFDRINLSNTSFSY